MSSIRTANAHRGFEYDSDSTPIGLVAAQRYAGLLTGGFLLSQDTTTTDTRDKYDDPDGRFGPATTADGVVTSYYFDGTDLNGSWQDVDGNVLIRF